MKKGFTLVEILIALLVLGILAAITINSLNSAKEKKELEGITDSIAAKLDEAKANSQSGKGGKNYGVKFNPDSYVFFSGTNFDPNDPSNQVFDVNDKYEITKKMSNGSDQIIFSKIYGETGLDATITISKKMNPSMSMSVVIGRLGDVSVIK